MELKKTAVPRTVAPIPDFMQKDLCVSCKHPVSIHFEGKHRQCNQGGCKCERYIS